MFRDRERKLTFWELKRQEGREPVRLLPNRNISATSISISHCGNIPSSWFSLRSRVPRVFCVEIQFGISTARPQDLIFNSYTIQVGTIFALLFHVRLLLPIKRCFRPFISNNHNGISPLSKLLSKWSISIFINFWMDGGMAPVSLLWLKSKFFPIPSNS